MPDDNDAEKGLMEAGCSQGQESTRDAGREGGGEVREGRGRPGADVGGEKELAFSGGRNMSRQVKDTTQWSGNMVFISLSYLEFTWLDYVIPGS